MRGIAALRASGETPTCQWVQDDEDGGGPWRGACGKEWEFINDGPVENGLTFCMKCGRRVELPPPPADQTKETSQ